MSDLVERLRRNAESGDSCRGVSDDMTEAAIEIERLRAVVAAAAIYYEHYMQDEAEDVDACVCGAEQHERAASVRDALRASGLRRKCKTFQDVTPSARVKRPMLYDSDAVHAADLLYLLEDRSWPSSDHAWAAIEIWAKDLLRRMEPPREPVAGPRTTRMEKHMKLIYIGDHFYHESGTMMSSIYGEDGTRSDWGKVQVALRAGQPIEIRQATQQEQAFYEAHLSRMKRDRESEKAV